jgi:uroporphyrinogen-III synthase
MERRKSKRLGGQSTAEPILRTIAVARPVGKGEDTAEFVRRLGWTPFIFHTVDLVPVENLEITNQLQYCLNQGPIAWIVFMSSSGVRLLFDSIGSDPSLQKALETTRFLAVGPKTRDTLAHYGISQAFLPEKYSSAGIDEFFSRTVSKNLRVVLIRSAFADDSLANSLASRGIAVRTINAYDSVMPKDLRSVHEFLDKLSRGRFVAVLFTSSVAVSNLFKIAKMKLDESNVVELLRGVHVGAIGPATARELQSRGIGAVMPDEYLIENALLKLTAQKTTRRVQTVAD